MGRTLLIFMVIFTPISAFSKGHFNYLEFPYVVKKKESFFSILSKVFIPGVKHTIKSNHVQNIIIRNPHIKNWKKLSPGQTITIFAKEILINKKEMVKNVNIERKRRKGHLEKSVLDKIEEAENKGYFQIHYNRSAYDATEVLPENLDSSFETLLGLGLEYILSFNRDLSPLRLSLLARWNYYKNVNFISTTNPERIYTEVDIPSTWDFSLSLAKEDMWNKIGLSMGLEKSILYNVEFSSSLDRNLLRTNENIWIDVGLEYPITFQSLKFNISTSLGRPMLIKTYLTDLIGNEEFSEAENNIELSGVRQNFSGEVIYKNYFFIVSYINSKFSKDKTITFKEVKSRIGIRF